MYPDGGIARFRVHGEGLLDLENGGRISACSNMFYGSPNNLSLAPLAWRVRAYGRPGGDDKRYR